jgi:2-oxoglutarate ferredoxin oxidoreductase subunit beta
VVLENVQKPHPCEAYVKLDDTASAWCSGCGIGTVLNTFVQAMMKLELDPKRVCVVSGSGCSAGVIGFMKLESRHVFPDRVVSHAMAIGQKQPDCRIIVFTSNMDFCADGISDLKKAGHEKRQLCLIHINNIIYTITKHGSLAATPFTRQSEDDGYELPFNMPHIAKLAGAGYVARWTSLHVRRLLHSMTDAMQRKGLSFVEIVSPCLIYNAINENIGETLERTRFCHDHNIVGSGMSTFDLDIRKNEKIVMGIFVDEKPSS